MESMMDTDRKQRQSRRPLVTLSPTASTITTITTVVTLSNSLFLEAEGSSSPPQVASRGLTTNDATCKVVRARPSQSEESAKRSGSRGNWKGAEMLWTGGVKEKEDFLPAVAGEEEGGTSGYRCLVCILIYGGWWSRETACSNTTGFILKMQISVRHYCCRYGITTMKSACLKSSTTQCSCPRP